MRMNLLIIPRGAGGLAGGLLRLRHEIRSFRAVHGRHMATRCRATGRSGSDGKHGKTQQAQAKTANGRAAGESAEVAIRAGHTTKTRGRAGDFSDYFGATRRAEPGQPCRSYTAYNHRTR
jgi:hypothetical protein